MSGAPPPAPPRLSHKRISVTFVKINSGSFAETGKDTVKISGLRTSANISKSLSLNELATGCNRQRPQRVDSSHSTVRLRLPVAESLPQGLRKDRQYCVRDLPPI
jgi:hypothetical protein